MTHMLIDFQAQTFRITRSRHADILHIIVGNIVKFQLDFNQPVNLFNLLVKPYRLAPNNGRGGVTSL